MPVESLLQQTKIPIHFCYAHSQASLVLVLQSSRVSQLFAHCVSISDTEAIITHSPPLSIAVHLHQTLTREVAPSELYHTIVWVVPKTSGNYKRKLYASR